MSNATYSIYLVRCADGKIYTGIATDVVRRLGEHQSGNRGAKYLRGRGPLELVFVERVGDRAVALRIEHRVKKLDRAQKQALIAGDLSLSELLQQDDEPAGQASGAACG